MEMSEAVLERWLERSGKFFRTLARNPVVRAVLLSRGLTDEELKRGWDLYAKINGFSGGAPAHAATPETTAAQAMDELDAWDAPAYRATKAILQVRYPEVERFLFETLEASTGSAAVAGVERFLDRITALRTGKAEGINAKVGKAAVELLATRKALDPEREARLRTLVQTVHLAFAPSSIHVVWECWLEYPSAATAARLESGALIAVYPTQQLANQAHKDRTTPVVAVSGGFAARIRVGSKAMGVRLSASSVPGGGGGIVAMYNNHFEAEAEKGTGYGWPRESA